MRLRLACKSFSAVGLSILRRRSVGRGRVARSGGSSRADGKAGGAGGSQTVATLTTPIASPHHRRRARRRRVAERTARDGRVAVLQPALRRPLPQKTKVWIGHDADYLYFAFQCDDPEPSGDQDLDHPPRQHLGRRLGRHQPRRARHRTALLSPDGQSERRAARHAEQRRRATKISRPTTCGTAPAGGTRRATPSRCACRCRPSASRAGPTCRWGSCSGGASAAPACRSSWPPLEPGKWVFEKHASLRVRRSAAAAHPRGHPVDDVSRGPSSATRRHAGAAPTTGRRRRQRQVRHHVDGHARRDGQSRLQPGRERRVPGRSQPALPDLLLGEASVLHGRRGHLHARRPGQRQQPAGRRPHAPHRRSGVRRQGDRQPRARDVRHADGARPGARATICPTGDPDTDKDRLFNIGRVQYSLGPSNYVGGARRRHRVRRRLQPRRRRGSVVARELDAARQRVRARFVVARSARRRVDDGHRRAGRLRVQHAPSQSHRLRRALRSATSRWTRRSSTASASRAGGATPSTTSIRRRPSAGCCKVAPFSFTQGGHDRERRRQRAAAGDGRAACSSPGRASSGSIGSTASSPGPASASTAAAGGCSAACSSIAG